MNYHTLLVPIPAGKTEQLRQMAKEALGARSQAHHHSRHRHGWTREMAWIHSTPMGDMVVLLLEGHDPKRAMSEFIASKDPHDVWFREQLLGALGIDLSQGAPPEGELFFDWHAG